MSNRYKGAVISATPPTTSGGPSGVASGAWTLEQQLQLQAASLWPSQPPPPNIEDVFSTYLYTGTGSALTITNGINLSGKGGLVWIKSRDNVTNHSLADTVRGSDKNLASNTTAAQITEPRLSGFTSSGFSLTGGYSEVGGVGSYVSWTFREQPKFFDVVTWTGDGTAGRTVAHNLGSVPGSIFVKCTSFAAGGGWPVYHRSLGNTQTAVLNTTDAAFTYGYWNNTTPTSTVFTLNSDSDVNGSGKTYVAYLFAHDAGGFGLTETDNVISCGTFVTGSGGKMTAPVNLGYEVQWLLVKNSGSSENWQIYDTMRGMSNTGYSVLYPNLTSAEYSGASAIAPNATGFDTPNASGPFASFANYIYVAIRRGPMAVPTVGTSVYNGITRTGTGAATNITGAGFPIDLLIQHERATSNNIWTTDRLRGTSSNLDTQSTAAENTNTFFQFDKQDGFGLVGAAANVSGRTMIDWVFRRAPSVFDIVCYTGTGVATTQAHNLGVVPELMIVKRRSAADDWAVYTAATGNGNVLFLNLTDAVVNSAGMWNSTTPTSSVFSIGTSSRTNSNAVTYVAYLFATAAGVSKVGTYTGNGSTQTIDCGFGAGGVRFVLLKRTDVAGGWYVYDTARGMTVLTDPYLFLNDAAVEVATLGSVTTVSTGFALNSAILAAINVSAGTYIFLAIA